MGVTGLWTVLQPVARPVKLETLNRKRLAVDASIWIYQFLKAVRDKEGNALRNSHVVGFFRRICKLLFFGIKPVFVFDGGAPVLKRQTIATRKARREGRREDAVRTAGKLLAVQMHRRAEEEDRKRREERAKNTVSAVPEEEHVPDDQLNYVAEQLMTPQERQQNRKFKKKDAYHLPDLDVSLQEMGAPNDPRIMSQEELEEYARQFHEGEDINLYDFSKIDFDSPFFLSLPATDRYNILNAARLRSRLRMGYSKEQLDEMFPNRMEFSKFQIERVKERNDLTQRLMNINGMNPNDVGSGRIAGERGKEYVLVKNEGVEGGWALGVVSNKDEGKREQPIDVDKPVAVPKQNAGDESDDSFEDVPVQGLNRLPKRPKPSAVDLGAFQQGVYFDTQIAAASKEEDSNDAEESLFVPRDDESDAEDLFEDVPEPTGDSAEDDEELQRAIQMSLQQESDNEDPTVSQREADAARADRQRKEKALEFGKRDALSGRAFASYANARAAKAAPRPQGVNEKLNPELRAAFEAGRKMGHKEKEDKEPPSQETAEESQALAQPSEFKGPLPFESIDLGKSLFSKKKPKESDVEEEGGFEKGEEKDKPKPLPPWFAGDIDRDEFQHSLIQKQTEAAEDKDGSKPERTVIHQGQSREIIDLEKVDNTSKEPIEIDTSDEEDQENLIEINTEVPVSTEVPVNNTVEEIRTEGLGTKKPDEKQGNDIEAKTDEPDPIQATVYSPGEGSFEWEESDYEDRERMIRAEDVDTHEAKSSPEPDFEEVSAVQPDLKSVSPEPDFEDVKLSEAPKPGQEHLIEETEEPATLPEDEAFDQAPAEEVLVEDDWSDPEDEDLMRQLAVEAEEHARFAAQLNVATGLQSAEDYEKELKQLREQQKADRRDADEVTTIMIQECQQLLRLFGLPYITAPMEAEAQCAELVSLGLVDGIVTDDSDIFLFGGTRVYKNMFNQAKFVECYLFNDLEKEYGLSRQKIIQIAHLLGSDYTDGVPGVGPVTALEIMTEFGSVKAFQEWWDSVQTGMAPADAKGFKKRFRRNASKIFLPPGFPDPRVDQAYLKPEVDSDPSQFQWGVLDLEALRQFLMSTIGWSPARTDEILVPVIRDMNKRETEGTQANMTHFFGNSSSVGAAAPGRREAYAPRRRHEGKSSRMETALERLHQQTKRRAEGREQDDVEDEDASGAEASDPRKTAGRATKKRKTRAKPQQGDDTIDEDDEMNEDEANEDAYKPPGKTSKARRTTTRRQKP